MVNNRFYYFLKYPECLIWHANSSSNIGPTQLAKITDRLDPVTFEIYFVLHENSETGFLRIFFKTYDT